MSIAARWRKIENLPPARGRDAMPGVYELADESKSLIYIGQSARDVPNRIRQHLANHACLSEKLVYWRYRPSRVPQADEAELLAAYQAKHGKLPLCNQVSPLVRSSQRRYAERSRSD